jgi:hypothetical protein
MKRLSPGLLFKRLTSSVQWDRHRRTLYVRRRPVPKDLPQYIKDYCRTLIASPDDLGTRFLLANCLYATGQRAEAEGEWDIVAGSGDAEWTATVAELRQELLREPNNSLM